jgi:hypothetical protein
MAFASARRRREELSAFAEKKIHQDSIDAVPWLRWTVEPWPVWRLAVAE